MIARGMASCDFDSLELAVNIVTPRARAFAGSPVQVTETLPYWARRLPYRLTRPLAVSRIDHAFLQITRSAAAANHGAYIWSSTSRRTIKELKGAGIKVFREMINGPLWVAKHILDEAYERFGIDPIHGLDDAWSEAEREALHAVDYVFAPNPMVTSSLLKTGLPPHKILDSSYGWDPQRFSGTNRLLPPCEGITILFVGTICVRKGAHLLLDYWARSKLRGRLVLAGAMEPPIKKACAGVLARDDVKVLNYVSDVGALYRSADIFAFPTLEEGGPQVTYEACGCGLPVITTPMGTGRIAVNDKEGFVLDPYDASGWITAMQALAEDVPRRHTMGLAARESAELFRWDLVSARRKQQVLDCLQPASNMSCGKGAPPEDRRSAGDRISALSEARSQRAMGLA
jgi:glycosyltransferase involved in cell wall biosynthesis